MALGHVGLARSVLVVLPALVAVLLAACGGSSGVDTQTPTSDPSSSSTSTSPTPSTSVTTSTAAPSFSAPAIPTPTVTAPAQDAVNAYIALANAYNRASVEPAHADLATINKYLSGKALTLFDQSLSSMKSAGQAYRGTPADPRVKVQTVFSSSSVFLTSCPTVKAKNPFVEYYVATGKPVRMAKRNPPPPYLLTLPMQLEGSQWKLTDLIQNVSKTCS
jgi:hypothetical protein